MIHLSVGRLCAGWQIDVRSLYNAYQRLLALPVDVESLSENVKQPW